MKKMGENNFDDSDMKIIDDIKTHFSETEDLSEKTFLEIEKHKANGNMRLAEKLGCDAFEMVSDGYICGKSDDSSDEQARCGEAQDFILKFFSVNVALDKSVKNSILSRAAKAIISDKTEKNCPEIFDEMKISGAISLYYLKINSSSLNDIAYEIGESYASLCGDKNDKELISLGSRLFIDYVDKTNELLNKFEFKEILEEED